MASGKKIADGVGKMTTSPFISWIRDKLLHVRRFEKDMKTKSRNELVYQQRFPSDQSARTQPPPTVPGGIHHKLAQNYYLDHDARRAVEPPKTVLEQGKGDKTLIAAAQKETLPAVAVGPQVSLGPAQNYGLPSHIPTPGFGHEWTRNATDELPTQEKDEEFIPLERYDAYRQPARQ